VTWLRVSPQWVHRLRWIVIGWVVVFWRLGYPSLLDPDEAHYAELTREMLRSHSWFVPLLDGQPFIDKPVLFHWLQGASVRILGQTEFAVRLPSALAALALFATTRWIGTALFGEEVGAWGAIMFATIPATFALSSIALFDMVFVAFLFSAVGCLLIAAKDRRRGIEWTGYALLALATMTKGPVALVLVVLFAAGAWFAGGELRARIAVLHWKTGCAAAALAASPWFIWMDVQFGRAFVDGYLLAGNLWYFTQPDSFSRRAISHVFYVRAFAGAFFPWSVVVAGRAFDLVRRGRSGLKLSVDEKLLWLWVIVVIGFFSFARFKLDHYIFPAAPACCLIAARAWRDSADDLRGTIGARAGVFAIAALLIVGGSFGCVYLFDLNLELSPLAIVLPLALMTGGIALMTACAVCRWRVPRTAAIPVVMLLVVYLVTVGVGYPALEATHATPVIAKRIRSIAAPDAVVGLYQLERWRASLRYYLERPVTRLDDEAAVREFLAAGHPAYVVMRRREYDQLRAAGVPLREVMRRHAVIGTTGRGLRRQVWGYLVVARNASANGRPVWRRGE
jgi:4-amino-4-deoxy-L-arabinose transferase-like glycosyltransferase